MSKTKHISKIKGFYDLFDLDIITPVLKAFKICGMQRRTSGQVRPTGIKHLHLNFTISKEE